MGSEWARSEGEGEERDGDKKAKSIGNVKFIIHEFIYVIFRASVVTVERCKMRSWREHWGTSLNTLKLSVFSFSRNHTAFLRFLIIVVPYSKYEFPASLYLRGFIYVYLVCFNGILFKNEKFR